MAKRAIIYQSEHLTAVHSEHGSETVFASFNELGLRAAGDRFWGDELFDRVGASAIGFVSARPNWYPIADITLAIAAALPLIAGRRVVTYGHSQGGYGALKYGAGLGASFSLGFCPQWSINPADVASFDQRFMEYHDPKLHNGERIEAAELCPQNFIFLDPADLPDALNAARLLALGPVTQVPAPFSGHGTVRLIAEGGKGSALLQRCMQEPAPTAAELRAMLRACRARSRVYADEKVRQLTRTMRRHGRFLDAAVQAMPDGPGKTITAVTIDLAKGNIDAATAAMSTLSDDAILSLNFAQYWPVFRHNGFVYGESRIGPLYKQRYKDDLFQRLHGVNSLIKSGARGAALEELQYLATMPGTVQVRNHFIDFYRQLHRLDLALGFIADLATQNLEAARSALGLLSDEELLTIHFAPSWPAFRRSGFVHGESRLAPLYPLRYRDDVFQRLHGVNSLILTGAHAAALEELQVLARMPGASQQRGHFIDFYSKLGRTDLASAFAETAAGD